MQFDFNQTYKQHKASKLLEAFDFDEIDDGNDISSDIFDLKTNLMNDDVWCNPDIFDVDDQIQEMFKNEDTFKSALLWVGKITDFDDYEPEDPEIESDGLNVLLSLLDYDDFVKKVRELEAHGENVPVEALCLAYALDLNYCGLEWYLYIAGEYDSSYEESDPEVGYWGGTNIDCGDITYVGVTKKDIREEIGGFNLAKLMRSPTKYYKAYKKIIADDAKELYTEFSPMFSSAISYYETEIIEKIESYYD